MKDYHGLLCADKCYPQLDAGAGGAAGAGAGAAGEGSIFGSLTVKVDTIFFLSFFSFLLLVHEEARERWMLYFNGRLRMSSAAAIYLFIYLLEYLPGHVAAWCIHHLLYGGY